MNATKIREAVHAAPFRPFKIRTAGGPAVLVEHPEYIAIEPKGREIIVFLRDGSHRVLDTLLISEPEFPRKNGVSSKH